MHRERYVQCLCFTSLSIKGWTDCHETEFCLVKTKKSYIQGCVNGQVEVMTLLREFLNSLRGICMDSSKEEKQVDFFQEKKKVSRS